MDFKNGKPIVKYSNKVLTPCIKLNRRAYVYALDHPILGRQDVSTSRVISILTTNNGVEAFETRNTNYVLDSYVIPE